MSGVEFLRSLVTEFCNQIEDLGCVEGFHSRLPLIYSGNSDPHYPRADVHDFSRVVVRSTGGWIVMRMAVRVVAATILLEVGAPGLLAQSPEFEVATIKVNQTGSGGSNFPRLKNGTLNAENVSLLMLLQAAYDLSALRIVGPNWLDSDRYDVTGKSPQGVSDGELMPMLQALLKDRFRISGHREMKEMTVYEMIVGKDGLKMSVFDPTHPLVSPPNRNRGGAMIVGSGTMPQLAKMMSGPAGRPVLDKTGLSGRYNYILSFTPLSAQAAESASDSAPPDLFTAVQQQLGLKLESKKDPIEILVIDHAERVPAEN